MLVITLLRILDSDVNLDLSTVSLGCRLLVIHMLDELLAWKAFFRSGVDVRESLELLPGHGGQVRRHLRDLWPFVLTCRLLALRHEVVKLQGFEVVQALRLPQGITQLLELLLLLIRPQIRLRDVMKHAGKHADALLMARLDSRRNWVQNLVWGFDDRAV